MVRPTRCATTAALCLLGADLSNAQTYRDAGGTVTPGVVAVGGDGSGPLFTSANPGKVALSAPLGGFLPTPAYSAQSVGTVPASYPLPVGSVVVVYNTGANPITVKLGGGGVTVTAGAADVVQPGAWMAFAVGSATAYAVVGNGGPSAVVVSGGAGLPTGSGGGGGGGGSLTWPGSAAATAYGTAPTGTVPGVNAYVSGRGWSLYSGADSVSLGGTLPAFAATPTFNIGAAPTIAVTGTFWQATQPVSGSVTANQGGPPWTQNLTQLGGASVATGTGASNSGTLRVATSSDSPNAPFSAVASSSITRPANTTTYAAGTGWNNATSAATGYLSFTGACRANSGMVLIPQIDVYSSANPATKLAGVLYLFSAVPGALVNDNATFTLASADFANQTGGMQGLAFALANSQTSGAANSGASLTGVTYHAQCASGTTTIYGAVQVTNAYVPASGETLTVRLHTVGAN